ncbi:MAG: hypothetical protein WB821_06135, partial [Burkholderiaceae bacterium]
MSIRNRLFKHAAYWLCIAAALILAACGPGTGGTGTGPQSIAAFAANYISVPSTGTAVGSTTPSTGASSATTATFSLQLQTTGIVLTSACAGFDYAGAWSVSATGEISVQGLYASTGAGGLTSPPPQAAVLNIALTNTSADSASLTLRITTPSGALLLGPISMERSGAAIPTPQGQG